MKSLRQQIVEFLSTFGKATTLKEIYNNFPDTAQTTIRGRIYESIGNGIIRSGKGLYISEAAIIEHGDSLNIIDELVSEGAKFDFIFLDIPYCAGGQKGGNRNLSNYNMISPNEFGTFMEKCEGLLRTDKSPLLFMFTSGRSSKRQHDKYISQINLKQCNRIGTYQKMWANGNKMNLGQHTMPVENIYVFSKSGEVENIENWEMDFKLVPTLRKYPTEKPIALIKKLVEQGTKIGDWVLDTFGGSGKTLQACIELKRFCHIIDKGDVSFNQHLLTQII